MRDKIEEAIRELKEELSKVQVTISIGEEKAMAMSVMTEEMFTIIRNKIEELVY